MLMFVWHGWNFESLHCTKINILQQVKPVTSNLLQRRNLIVSSKHLLVRGEKKASKEAVDDAFKRSAKRGPVTWISFALVALAGGGLVLYVRHLKEEKEKGMISFWCNKNVTGVFDWSLILFLEGENRPFPNYLRPLFQSESRCSSFIHMQIKLIFMWMKIDLHMKGWAPRLALKKRPKVIQNGLLVDLSKVSHRLTILYFQLVYSIDCWSIYC